ncbi:MAG: 50S ribosomal protein L21 [Bdellovibrionales bacterium]
MYAIIRTGGKQYTVKPGDVLQVEKLDKELGSEFDINEVLLVGGDAVHAGQPLVKNAKVTVVVTKQSRTRKILVFKKKRRHSYRKFATHRQLFTELFVKSITSPDGKVTKTDESPNVIDAAAARDAKLQAKVDARRERVQNKGNAEAAPAPKKKAVAKKAAPKKKTAAKKSAKKSTGAKKTAKKSK